MEVPLYKWTCHGSRYFHNRKTTSKLETDWLHFQRSLSNDNGSVWDISINLVFTELTYHFLICTKVNTILIDLATVSVTLHSGYIIQIWYYENLFVQEKKSLQHKWKTSMFYMSFIYFKPSPSIESKLADIQYRRYWRRNSEISFSFEVYFSVFQEFIFTTFIGHVLKQPITKTITQN